MVDFFVVAVPLQLVFDGKKVDGLAGRVKADDGIKNELMFGAVEVVGVENGEDFGDDETLVQEHGREKLLLHFDSVGEVVMVKHENHLVGRRQKKRRHSVNAVFGNSNRKKPLQKISL